MMNGPFFLFISLNTSRPFSNKSPMKSSIVVLLFVKKHVKYCTRNYIHRPRPNDVSWILRRPYTTTLFRNCGRNNAVSRKFRRCRRKWFSRLRRPINRNRGPKTKARYRPACKYMYTRTCPFLANSLIALPV